MSNLTFDSGLTKGRDTPILNRRYVAHHLSIRTIARGDLFSGIKYAFVAFRIVFIVITLGALGLEICIANVTFL